MGKITKPKRVIESKPKAAVGLSSAGPTGIIKKKKVEKRKEKHEKLVQKLQAAADLTKKKEVEMKQKAQVGTLGMSSLSELLDSLMEKEQAMQAQTKNKKMDNKMKQKLAVTELEQFKNVLAHPAFQNDPLAIIKEHLKNKVAAVNSEREASNPRKVVPRHLQPKPAKEPQSAKPGSGGSGNHNAKKSNIGKNKAGRGGKGRK